MKSLAVFPSEKEIRIIESPEPEIKNPTDVKLKILDVGICGTDREISSFQYGTQPPGSEYLILGHEALAEVQEIGSGVSRVKPGDLVVPTVRRPCSVPDCFACRVFRQDFCFTGKFKEKGIKEEHGFLTEHTLEDERFLNFVPPHLREVGVLVEPLTIAEKALSQVWNIQSRLPWVCPPDAKEEKGYCHKALILGAGPVGLLGAMAIVSSGFETTVYSREPENSIEAHFSKQIGARYISSARVQASELTKSIGNTDLVYEATGAAKISFEVLSQLGTNGIFIFTGVPGRKYPMEINAPEIMRNMVLKNQVLLGTVNAGPNDYGAAIHDLELFDQKWPDAVRSLITRRIRLQDYGEALFSKGNTIKTVVSLESSLKKNSENQDHQQFMAKPESL